MGWTSCNMRQPIKEWFKEQWSYDNSDYEALDSALVKRQTLYGAIKQKSTGDVFCAVFLVRWSRGYYNFSYKSLTEHVGPCEYECPEKIFKLLTPLNDKNDSNGWAREWREKVKRFHKERKEINLGKLFKTEYPVHFMRFGKLQYFRRLNDEKKHNHYKHFSRNGLRFCAYRKENDKFILINSNIFFKFNPEHHFVDEFIKNPKII